MFHLGPSPNSPLIDLTQDEALTGPSGAHTPEQLARQHVVFIDHLANPDLWPPMEHRASLTRFLSTTLQQWPLWPRSLGLDVAGQDAFNEEHSQPIHVSTSPCSQTMLVTYQCIKGDDSCSVYLCRNGSIDEQLAAANSDAAWQWFPGLPNGFFDAVAAGLSMAGELETVLGRMRTDQPLGQQLRGAFTDWLRQRQPEWAPRVPGDVVWQRWAPPPAAGRSSAPPGSPDIADLPDIVNIPNFADLLDVASPSSISDSSRPAPAEGHQFPSIDNSCDAAQGSWPPPPAIAGNSGPATVEDAQSLIDCFRQGRWHGEMLAVLLPVLTRLSLQTDAGIRTLPTIHLIFDGGQRHRYYGRTFHSAGGAVTRDIEVLGPAGLPQFRIKVPLGGEQPLLSGSGVDGLLMAFVSLISKQRLHEWLAPCHRTSESRHQTARRIQPLLAGLLEEHQDFVRICMSIERRWPQHEEPDLLVRQCLEGRALTWAGQQVLDRSLVRQPLDTREDVIALLALRFAPGQRQAELFKQGYDLLLANQLITPLGPTRQAAIQYGVAPPVFNDALAGELAWYLHIYGGWDRVIDILGPCRRTLRTRLGPPTMAQAQSTALQSLRASTLLLPADGATASVPDTVTRAGAKRYRAKENYPLPAPEPGVEPTSVTEARAVVESIRAGIGAETSLPVICQALTHCDFGIPELRRVSALRLIRDDGADIRFGYGFDLHRNLHYPKVPILMEGRLPDARFRHGPDRILSMRSSLDGVDGLLVAFYLLAKTRNPAGKAPADTENTEQLQAVALRLRHSLADILSSQIGFVQLCATLHRQWPQHPTPSLLLRQCWHGGALTWEGQQVLDPSLISRSLDQHADRQELFQLRQDPGTRRNMLFIMKFPMLKANELLGPFGPTVQAGPDYRSRLKVSNHLERLDTEGGWLLYVQGSWLRLAQYLSLPHQSHQQLFGPERVARWEEQAMAYVVANTLRPLLPA